MSKSLISPNAGMGTPPCKVPPAIAESIKREREICGIRVYCLYDKSEDITELNTHPRNYNAHPDEQVAVFSKIIRANGWRRPITVSKRSGLVVKGHGAIQAAELLQVTHVPVQYQDYESDAQEIEDMIADNKLARLAEPEKKVLAGLLSDLDGVLGGNLELTGFNQEELNSLLAPLGFGEEPAPTASPSTSQSVTCPHCSETFELVKEGE